MFASHPAKAVSLNDIETVCREEFNLVDCLIKNHVVNKEVASF